MHIHLLSESMKTTENSQLRNIIQKVLNEEKPKTVKKLIERTVELSNADKSSIYSIIQELEKNKTIQLGSPKINRELPSTVFSYLFERNYYSLEFWLILCLTIIFFITTLVIQEGSSFLFLRVTMGIIFGVFIPGWLVVNLIFPKPYEIIDQIERLLFSLGINIGIMIFAGLILNQVWAISSLPFLIIIGSFSVFMLILSTGIRLLIGKGITAKVSQKIELKYQQIITNKLPKFKSKRRKGDSNEKKS